jgi:hypothetical protein
MLAFYCMCDDFVGASIVYFHARIGLPTVESAGMSGFLSFRIQSSHATCWFVSLTHAYTCSGHPPQGKQYIPAVGLPRRRRESDRPLS